VRWHAWGNIDWGVTLAEVYTAGGEVLMGTQRWEKGTRERRRGNPAAQRLNTNGVNSKRPKERRQR
jgi:circadian clock protein KaiC